MSTEMVFVLMKYNFGKTPHKGEILFLNKIVIEFERVNHKDWRGQIIKSLEGIAFQMSFHLCFTLKWLPLAIADTAVGDCLCQEISTGPQGVSLYMCVNC